MKLAKLIRTKSEVNINTFFYKQRIFQLSLSVA